MKQRNIFLLLSSVGIMAIAIIIYQPQIKQDKPASISPDVNRHLSPENTSTSKGSDVSDLTSTTSSITVNADDSRITFFNNEADLLETMRIAEDFGIDSADVFSVSVSDSVFEDMGEGDLLALPIPGEERTEMYIQERSITENRIRLKGQVDGLDKGFGITLINRNGNISGYIITPSYQYDIISIRRSTYLLRKPHDHDDSPLAKLPLEG